MTADAPADQPYASVRVADAPERNRYELTGDGSTLGFVQYRLRPEQNQIVLIHTEIDEAYTGRGFGTVLVKGMLDDIRDEGRRIVPLCPYIVSYLKDHHEYDGLIDRPQRRRP